jgi:hypothetical protein
MIEIVSEKVVRPSRLFLTCSYHQRWGSQPVLTQPVLTDTMCTHAHRTLAAVHPPSDTPPALHAHAEQSKRGKHLCCASFSPPLPPASMARLRTPSPLLARSPPLCRAARCRRTVADRRGSNRAVSRRAQVARAKGGVEKHRLVVGIMAARLHRAWPSVLHGQRGVWPWLLHRLLPRPLP